MLGKHVEPLEKVNTFPWTNREYLTDSLNLLENQLSEETGKLPSKEDLLACYMVGIKKFRKASYSWQQTTDREVRARMAFLEAGKPFLATLAREGGQSSPPPQLPINRPVPNFRGEWVNPNERQRR